MAEASGNDRRSLARWRICGLARALSVAALTAVAAVSPLAAATAVLRLVDLDGTPVADGVFAAYPLDDRPPGPPLPAIMDQRERRFVPRVLPVQTGARVTFPNSDTVSHHVYSFSSPRQFQLFLEKAEPPQHVAFDRPGVVTLGCNLHDWMLGYVVVLDTAYFAVTGANGHASLDELPGGDYRLEVWHPRFSDPKTLVRRAVRLEGAETEIWELRLDRPLLPARDQKPGFVEY